MSKPLSPQQHEFELHNDLDVGGLGEDDLSIDQDNLESPIGEIQPKKGG